MLLEMVRWGLDDEEGREVVIVVGSMVVRRGCSGGEVVSRECRLWLGETNWVFVRVSLRWVSLR